MAVVFYVKADTVHVVAVEALRERPGYWRTRLRARGSPSNRPPATTTPGAAVPPVGPPHAVPPASSSPRVSVFLEVPESAWVAANPLAFAFRDRFPVAPGHTLIVTRRVTPDWFTATEAERAA